MTDICLTIIYTGFQIRKSTLGEYHGSFSFYILNSPVNIYAENSYQHTELVVQYFFQNQEKTEFCRCISSDVDPFCETRVSKY
jgi:hypothetical protein